MNPIRIGIDANEANIKDRVGSNQYAYEITKALESLDDQALYTIYLNQLPLAHLPSERKNWKYRVFGPSSLWTQWRLPLDLYVHRPRPNVFLSLTHYAPRFSPIPRVITIFDLAFLKFPQFFRKKDVAQLTQWTEYSAKKAAHIITISQNSKQDIVDAYQINPSKITVAYPGFSHQRVKVASQEAQQKAKEKHNIGSDYILYVGTLQPRKNLVRLIKAFENLPQKFNNLNLVIAGKKGWLYENLVTKINQSSKKSHLRLTGFVDESDLSALYSGAQCLVLPGLYEGFGIPPLEALACNTIPVVANTGALPEVVGEYGIKFNPYKVSEIGQALEKTLQLSQTQKKQMLDKAKSHLKQFDWYQSAEKIKKVLYDIAI